MKQKTNSISINLLSAFVILMCLFVSMIQPVNAWFTDSHEEGVQVEIFVGNIKLNLYQNSIADGNKILTNTDNDNIAQDSDKKYVTLNSEIEPDEWVELKLILANNDTGSSGMYFRYKFELFVKPQSANRILTTYLTSTSDITASNLDNNVTNFTYSDGWFTYSNGTSDAVLSKGESATIMTHFKVPYEEFVDADYPITNSDTVYIKLTVEAQTAPFNS